MSAPDATPDERLPLHGVRVLDAGDFLAAPFCAMTLGDWGADVIKVEGLAGDTSRAVGELVAEPDVSAIFVSGNRGKRSVSLDLRSDAGRGLLRRLALSCDIVVHNRTERQAAGLGLDHASLSADAPGIIVGSVTAFGDVGPYAGRGALDPIAQAMSGMMSVTGPVDGPPTRAAVTVVDFGAGLTLATGVLAALAARATTGRGRAVTTSLLDVGLTFSSSLFPLTSVLGGPPPRLGNRSHPLLADQFATRDGFVVLAVWDERRWRALCALLRLDALADDPTLATNAARLQAYDRVQPALQERLREWGTAELVPALVEIGVLCSPTYDIPQVAADPHVRATGALYDEERLAAPFRMVRGPLRMDGERAPDRLPPPRLGEHTTAILTDTLGLAPDEVGTLLRAGTVRQSPA